MKKKETLKVTQLPDVFDEDTSAKPVVPVVEAVTEKEMMASEPQPVEEPAEELPTPRAPRIVTEVEEEPEVAPMETKEPETMQSAESEPTFTVRQNGQTVEQKLPSFFVEGSQGETSESEETGAQATEPQSQETQALEAAVPQAFVGEVNQVAKEVKRERRGTLVTVFIILGMILVAGGVVGLFVMNTRKNGTEPTPQPTAEIQATPIPTPTVINNTATQSATASVSADLKQEVKVNVLNGTTIKGLASKEAAVLRKNGFTLGTVGNGDPAKAGTIVVPTGRLDMGQEIQSLLTEFTFSLSESADATAITLTLGEPQE